MAYNQESRYKPMYPWSTDFQQGHQHHSVEEITVFSTNTAVIAGYSLVPKALATKETDILDFIKIKNTWASKNTIEKVEE